MLDRLGLPSFEAKKPEQLEDAAGLVIPGGESTTLWKFFESAPWEEAIARFAASGRPVLGTCAGAIVLARQVSNPAQKGLGLLDIAVERNAYGRQADSFVGAVEAPALGGELPAVFIRAPKILRVGPEVEVLATREGEPVLARQDNVVAATFHPELTDDERVHRMVFAGAARAAEKRLSLVEVIEEDGIAVVSLDRPPANAFAPDLVSRLRAVLRERAGAKAIVLTSANPKLFSAGWDLPLISALDRAGMKDYLENYLDLVREVFVFRGPFLAALTGHAIAGGLIVASAADERYAAEGAGRFGLSEVALGVPLPACCLELFRYLLGSRTMERLTASAENMPSDRALAMGLLDRVVPSAGLLDSALERARQLSRGSALAYAEVKRRARAEAMARFDAGPKGRSLPRLLVQFRDARDRIAALMEKLTGKTNSSSRSS